MLFRQINGGLPSRQIRAHAMLVQPCLCLAYNGFRRILDTANGLVHGCPENNIGCLRNFRFSIFDHVASIFFRSRLNSASLRSFTKASNIVISMLPQFQVTMLHDADFLSQLYKGLAILRIGHSKIAGDALCFANRLCIGRIYRRKPFR